MKMTLNYAKSDADLIDTSKVTSRKTQLPAFCANPYVCMCLSVRPCVCPWRSLSCLFVATSAR